MSASINLGNVRVVLDNVAWYTPVGNGRYVKIGFVGGASPIEVSANSFDVIGVLDRAFAARATAGRPTT